MTHCLSTTSFLSLQSYKKSFQDMHQFGTKYHLLGIARNCKKM
ncbi:hypothetical protein HMPREF6745_0882 [Prevotella sp. oral taxon 472 str. F0295]|nr:hypothetical protein HMPREF6745_0882 [Prevotella sp. oral taxon 472 str. F0295]